MNDNLLTSLRGKRVKGIYVSEGEDALKFQCVDGSNVIRVTERDLPDEPIEGGRSRQDVDIVYGYQIDTNKGSSQIAFRNSSNGYYGGWAEIVPEDTQQEWVWREITEDDWQA